jgi:hypothetical protein
MFLRFVIIMSKIKKILSLFLAVLFMSYYASTVFFSHIHIISGATITHSHFHDNSHHDTKSGGHTENCITLIAQISHFEYIDFSCNFTLAPQQFQWHKNKVIEIPCKTVSIHLQNLSLRAPPIV